MDYAKLAQKMGGVEENPFKSQQFKQSADPLLDMIALGEANRNSPHGEYGGMSSGIKNAPDVSTMTIGQVKAYQKEQVAKGAKSSAAGRYQIINKSM